MGFIPRLLGAQNNLLKTIFFYKHFFFEKSRQLKRKWEFGKKEEEKIETKIVAFTLLQVDRILTNNSNTTARVNYSYFKGCNRINLNKHAKNLKNNF